MGWMVAKRGSNLCVEVLRAKYLQGLSFFECLVKLGDLFVWRSIMGSRNIIAK